MKVPELDELIRDVLTKDDHPEIVRVELLAGNGNPKEYHPRVKVHYANGGSTVVQVFSVTGPKVSNVGNYKVPQEVL